MPKHHEYTFDECFCCCHFSRWWWWWKTYCLQFTNVFTIDTTVKNEPEPIWVHHHHHQSQNQTTESVRKSSVWWWSLNLRPKWIRFTLIIAFIHTKKNCFVYKWRGNSQHKNIETEFDLIYEFSVYHHHNHHHIVVNI